MSVDARWEKFVREAIIKLERYPGDWVHIRDLRPILDGRGLSRSAQDSHLKRLSRASRINIAPNSDRKSLTDRDHDAAIAIGGQWNHLIELPPNNR